MNEAFEKWAKKEEYIPASQRWHDAKNGWQACEAKMREPMACGHPRGCLEMRGAKPTGHEMDTADMEYAVCLVCEARDAALLEAAKEVCGYCQRGDAVEKWEDNDYHHPMNRCSASRIHRLREGNNERSV